MRSPASSATPTSSHSRSGRCPPRRSSRRRGWWRAGASPTRLGDLDGAATAYESAIAIDDGLAYFEPPYWYYPVRQSLGSVRLRQGRLDDAEKAFRESLARVRNNGWALAGLVEVARKRGDVQGERTARTAFERAWFGAKEGPELSRL